VELLVLARELLALLVAELLALLVVELLVLVGELLALLVVELLALLVVELLALLVAELLALARELLALLVVLAVVLAGGLAVVLSGAAVVERRPGELVPAGVGDTPAGAGVGTAEEASVPVQSLCSLLSMPQSLNPGLAEGHMKVELLSPGMSAGQHWSPAHMVTLPS